MGTVAAAEADRVVYAAGSPEIRYVGRIAYQSGADVSFDWSGTYLSTKFTGGECSIVVSDTKKSYYNVFVDDRLHGVVVVHGQDTTITLVSGLSRGEHLLRLQKRSEAEQGLTTIHSFVLGKRGELRRVESVSDRHIEFIGNSLTCGYGTEGKIPTEPFKAETENCDKAFACIIARYFDADYSLIAHSGRGAARNYGDSASVSKRTMADRMMYLMDEYEDRKWDFKGYVPDLVVINLGSNDFSTKPHPTKEQFAASYARIIAQLREGYGDVSVLCIAPRINEPAFTYIRDFCNACEDKNVHFAAILPGIYNADSDLGSSGHPNYIGQRKMAMALIPYVSTITGWQINSKTVE